MPRAPRAALSNATVRESLQLRSWALSVLDHGRDTPPPQVSGPAWEVFLATERCALPLQRALGQRGAGVGTSAAEFLRAAAETEARRLLSARMEARRVADALHALNRPGILLKGGVMAVAGDGVDLADVDVLVRVADAELLATALALRGGHRPVRDPVQAGQAGHWHLAGLHAPNALPVEIHYALPLLGGEDPWEGAVPTALPALWMLQPRLHLWHVLLHGCAHHADRCGSLRDLVVLSDAWNRCDDAARERVVADAARHPAHRILCRALRQLRGEGEAGLPPGADPFRVVAALRYLLAAAPWEGYDGDAGRRVVTTAFALTLGAYGRLWGRSHDDGILPPYESRRGVMRRGPRALLRAGRLVLATPEALRLARRAARLAAS